MEYFDFFEFFSAPLLWGLMIISLMVYFFICRVKKRKPSVLWICFILLSVITFWLIFIVEMHFAVSGGGAYFYYRYHPVSIIIGYALILGLYGFLIGVLKGETKLPKWTAVFIVLLIAGIFFKNTYFVSMDIGNTYYETYFPNQNNCIGTYDDKRNDIEKAKYPMSDIKKITIENNEIIFNRRNCTDYKISKWFLFWKLDIDTSSSWFFQTLDK